MGCGRTDLQPHWGAGYKWEPGLNPAQRALEVWVDADRAETTTGVPFTQNDPTGDLLLKDSGRPEK